MSPEGLDLLVDAFDLAAGDPEGSMGNDPFEVLIQKLTKPEKMAVAGGLADVHDINDFLCHAGFVRILVSFIQLFLDKVESE